MVFAALWTSSLLAAEEPAAPGRFVPDRRSRPIEAAPAADEHDEQSAPRVRLASNSRIVKRKAVHITFLDDPAEKGGPAVLRWRSSAVIEDRGIAQAQATLDSESGPYLAAPAVLESNDSFSDPFDDATEVRQSQAAEEEQPAGDDEMPPQTLEPDQDSELELPMDDEPQRLREEEPMPSSSEFNNRDCASDLKTCETARQMVKNRSIRQISLDISPVFNPAPDETSTPPAERSREFEQIDRQWRNNAGAVIATGAMTGIEHGRVLITDREGTVQRIEYRELSDEDLCYFAGWWGIPTECTLGNEDFAGRTFTPSTFTWKASALCHKPLYFEEVQLERYGHTTGPIFQPVISGAHFFLNIAALPYNAGIHPPMECQYALGYYRPGDCAPWLLPPIPLSLRGALAEAGVIVGGIYILP